MVALKVVPCDGNHLTIDNNDVMVDNFDVTETI